ncbi:MAG: HD domain-containing protein [Deltaproteobacteria bacterium]|nr:HD domain-containing protein [Deltaproteobacteria bacterium]
MIDHETVLAMKAWFKDYVKRFHFDDPENQRNIDLKEKHSMRVCAEILDIGKSLNLENDSLCLAEVIALFHDIGRFEQYFRYATFVDSESENHAILGVRILREEGVLKKIDLPTSELIFRAITYHNRAKLPTDETGKCLLFSRLLRDADKLDIWRVVTDYYLKTGGTKNKAIELGLPDSPEISDETLKDLMAEKIVKFSSIKTLNDFKLLQIGWVYDVNFKRTFQLIQERGYIEIIRDILPKSDKISKIYSKVQSYLKRVG